MKPSEDENTRFFKMFGVAIKAVDVVIDNMDKGQYIQAKAAAMSAKSAMNEMIDVIAGSTPH